VTSEDYFHLRVLEGAGMVRAKAVGRENRFEFQVERLTLARDYLDTVSREWDEALGRLRAFVE
jgi:hypothetical protein